MTTVPDLLDRGAVPITLASATAAGGLVAMLDPQWITTVSTGLLGLSTAVAIVIREYHKSRKESNQQDVEQLETLLADRDQQITNLHSQISELLKSNQELMRAVTASIQPLAQSPQARHPAAHAAADPAQPAAVVAVPVVAVPAVPAAAPAAPAPTTTDPAVHFEEPRRVD